MSGLQIPVETTQAEQNLRDLTKGFKAVGTASVKAESQVKGFRGVIGKVRGGVASLTSAFFGLKGAIAGALGGATLGLLGKSFLNAAKTSEAFNVRLKVLLGSAEAGGEVFRRMSEYAGSVPFQFEEIMESATALSGVMKGGVDEISEWMPLVGDLAAATGLSIQDTTSQIIRMYSAGAASADMFRERGVLAMLGFQAGVSYSAEETREMLMKAFQDPQSQFAGAASDLAKTWSGMMSMIGDKWFAFRNMVMDSGVFDYLKAALSALVGGLDNLKSEGRMEEWAKSTANVVIKAFNIIIKGAALVADAFRGWKMIWLGLKEVWHLLTFAMLKGVSLMYDGMSKFTRSFSGMVSTLGDKVAALGKALGSDMLVSMGEQLQQTDQLADNYDTLSSVADDLAEAEYDKLKAINDQVVAMSAQDSYYQRAVGFVDDINQKVEEARRKAAADKGKAYVPPAAGGQPEQVSKEDQRTRSEFDEAYDETFLSRYDLEIQKLDELKQKYLEAGVEKARVDEWYAEKYKNILTDTEMALMKLGDTIDDTFAGGMVDAMGEFISGAKSAKQAFSEFATSFAIDIGKMIAKQLLLNAIQSAGGSYGMFGSAVAGFASSMFKADGGSVYAGRQYIVGERGPERFVSDRGDSAVVGANGPESFSPGSKGRIDPNGSTMQPKIVIANITDPKMINDWANSSDGQDAIMNVISNNKEMMG